MTALGPILSVSTSDTGGGAERVARTLFEAYRARGLASWLAVGRKESDDADIFTIPNALRRNGWEKFWWQRSAQFEAAPNGRTKAWIARRIAEPVVSAELFAGVENFHFPGTRDLLDLVPARPQIVQCHNLHGGYFDLRALAELSRTVPVFVTLHDTWMMTGHCCYTFSCERYKTGCGHCPDLSIVEPIMRDASAYNWRRKSSIYRSSRLHICTPSQWLMDMVDQSMLRNAIVDRRVIPNGVDTEIFNQLGDKLAMRAELGLPADARVLMFAAVNARTNRFKDYETLRAAVGRVTADRPSAQIILLAVGDSGGDNAGAANTRFIPFVNGAREMAKYYQAADIYVHSAKEENFPVATLEALACGLPVVASAVGGVPEQIRGLRMSADLMALGNSHADDTATGILVGRCDVESMASAIGALLDNPALARKMGDNAAADAANRFSLAVQVEAYLAWYAEVCNAAPG